jgi:outer membrane biogenesis lipoprotein LolB
MSRVKCLLLLLVCLCGPVIAQGADASGVWQSTTGYVFRIPASSQHFDLIITAPNGQRMLGQGQWVQTGQSFSYTVSGMSGSAFANYNPQHDALEVKGPNGTSWWRRASR